MMIRASRPVPELEGTAVTVWQGVGLLLVIAGVAEFVAFRYLAPRRENIARRIRYLNANALLNVAIGVVLLIVGAR